MDDDDIVTDVIIKALADAEVRSRNWYQMLCAINTAGKSEEELRKLNEDYAIAYGKWIQAKKALRAYIDDL